MSLAGAASLDPVSVRRTLLAAARADGGHEPWQPDGVPISRESLVSSAVLVPFVLGPAPGVLLTRRVAHLSTHAGQVSFPGGRIEAQDEGPEAAALREAQEEIGLDPTIVEVLGRLDDHLTISGYRVTPVLAALPAGLELAGLALRPSPHEVETVFELPLSVLLDPDAPQKREISFGGSVRRFWVWPHPQQYIWGTTAAILVNLAERLRAAERCLI